MGVAVLEGRELLFWGVAGLREKRLEDLLSAVGRRLGRLIRRYRPTLLVAEKPTLHRLQASPWLSAITARISAVALEAGLEFRLSDPTGVRKRLCGSVKASRRDLAGRVVAVYPHLSRYQNDASRWQESYWLPMLAAVSVALAAAQGLSPLPVAPCGGNRANG